jgi:uncharacterized DUF497 family protein
MIMDMVRRGPPVLRPAFDRREDVLDLSRFTGFDWDDSNREKILRKHSVTPTECEELFINQPMVQLEDPAHSASEPRFIILGKTNAGRRLSCVVTERGERLRVVTCRPMNRKERSQHEET